MKNKLYTALAGCGLLGLVLFLFIIFLMPLAGSIIITYFIDLLVYKKYIMNIFLRVPVNIITVIFFMSIVAKLFYTDKD